jgi:flagellar biosynthesis protein FliR
LLAVVRTAGIHPAWWQLTVAVLVVGIGMGICIGTIFDTALGDIDHDEAGAASGSLSAVQQIAAGLGSAAITSIYFSALAGGGQVHAMTLSLGVVLAITTACLAVVPMLPRKAAGLGHG